jgi:hypothetical protein
MNNFPNPPIDNIAGIADFNFIEVEGVNKIPIPIDHRIIYVVTLVSPYTWLKGYSSIDTLQYSESSKVSDNGPYIEAQLKGFVPDSPEMLQQLVKMDGRRFVVHLTDNDGLERISGTIDQPLIFSFDFETQTVSGVKGYRYKFKGLLEKRAPIYDLPIGNGSSSGTSAT